MTNNSDFWMRQNVWMFRLRRQFDAASILVNLFHINSMFLWTDSQASIGVRDISNPFEVRRGDDLHDLWDAFINRDTVAELTRSNDTSMAVRISAITGAIEHSETEVHLGIIGIPQPVKIKNDKKWWRLIERLDRQEPDYDADRDDPIPF